MIAEPKGAQLDEALAAAGLPQGTTIWANLANAIMAAYDAYQNGTSPSVTGYNTVALIWVQESFFGPSKSWTAERPGAEAPPPRQKDGATSEGNTLIGFAAYAQDYTHNIIILRGTATEEETGYDLEGWGTNTACMLPSNNPVNDYGQVKQDLYNFYVNDGAFGQDSLAKSFNEAVQQVAAYNPDKPWIVAAHSLGGALAALGALDAYVSGSYTGGSTPPLLVTYGSLHLGLQSFADAFTAHVPSAFRFANLCDFVPSLVSLEPNTYPSGYVHIGLELTFLWQKWDNWANHSMQYTYLPLVQNDLNVVHVGPRQYPS